MAAKGILKKQQDRKDAGRLHWDEDNLMIAEATRGGKMTITEPKTPFIRYDSATNMILGHSAAVPPLELERAIADQASASEDIDMDDFSLGAGMDAVRANEDDDRFGGRQSNPPNVVPLDAAFLLEAAVVGTSGLRPGGAFGLGGAMEAPQTSQDVEQQEEDRWEDEDEDEKNLEDPEKQHEFEDHRKSHYNMREAMMRAKHLIELEEDDENEDAAGKEGSEKKIATTDDDEAVVQDEEDDDWSGPEEVVVK